MVTLSKTTVELRRVFYKMMTTARQLTMTSLDNGTTKDKVNQEVYVHRVDEKGPGNI